MRAIVLSLSLLVLSSPAWAHETKQTGATKVTVGWKDEPPIETVINAVVVSVTDDAGRPVTEGIDLKLEVVFANTPGVALAMKVTAPGTLQATVFPTRPGKYTFRLAGTLRGSAFKQDFAAAEDVISLKALSVPNADPLPRELAEKISALPTPAPQPSTVRNDFMFVVFVIVGLAFGLRARRRRQKP